MSKGRKKITDKFNQFLDDLHDEFNLHEFKNITSYSQKNEKLKHKIQNLTSHHKKKFSSFLEEYIQDAIISNDDFQEAYTKLNEIDLSTVKSANMAGNNIFGRESRFIGK